MQTPAERFPRLRELFHEMIDLPAGEREERLAGLPPEDGGLAPSLRELLAAADSAEDPVAAALSGIEREPEPGAEGAALIGRRIGPWEIVRLIGHGGMGSVFLARRADGAFTQEVALKLIRPGFASSQLLQRFRDERQVLASLAHPHIARLLDGGTTGDGLPYLVMEHVEGTTLEEHCAVRGLGLGERVELFFAVCAAVEHAHRNLVVHRDLKPGNILVTPAGEPKLLDFGIAKLLGRESADATRLTLGAATLGTVAFASPEQLRGETVTTVSDVYSLGVVLYRLLSGRHPCDLEDAPLPEAVRRVCESEPPPPSRAAAEAGDAAAARALRGDLDNIVLLALRKSPAERYPSVAALAADLRAWREGLPVAARQPTLRYRAGKLVRRHGWGVAAAAVVLLSLVGGFGAAAWSARQAREEARRAETERRKAEAVSQFLQNVLTATSSSVGAGKALGGGGAGVTVAEVLDDASIRVGQLGDQPSVEAALRRAIGSSYSALGLYPQAERELRRALQLFQSIHGDAHLETARAAAALGTTLCYAGQPAAAAEPLEKALAIYRRLPERQAAEEAVVLNGLGLVRMFGDDHAAAEHLFEEGLAAARRSDDLRHPVVLIAIANLGQIRDARGDLAGAEAAYRESLSLRDGEPPGWEHAFLLAQLGNVVALRGDLAEAERLLRRSLAEFAATAGEDYHWAARPHTILGWVLQQRGDLPAAEAELRRALAILRQAVPDDNLDVLTTKALLGGVLVDRGRAGEAEPLLHSAWAVAARSPVARVRGLVQSSLGHCLLALGRREEAEPLLRGGYRTLHDSKGTDHPYTRQARRRLAHLDALR